ncbi:hypothetical protein GNI_175540 [Gregarina niphandrodes]|uniref:Uncharacterized protein n=1 Tax=Gregarina niphandrodes TaxID=110365 RepID=A0A023AY39_GRENI|nr:hypothetical protein GNI_175540 [Gregarina niphandrodes]EZG43363.1 hypothetical protein GNI_175540 [Gregarina niphandrodes]|eukprot:XP_011134656.1 hypothetical protein GNI_175540 [Gregarina niphandrodes]
MRSVFGVRSRSLELAERLAYVVNPDGSESAITEDMDMRLLTVGVRRKGVLVDGMTLLAVAPKARMRVLDSLAPGSKFWRVGVPQSPMAAGAVPAGTVFRIENERSKPVDEEKAQLMANEDKANEDKANEDKAKEDKAYEAKANEGVSAAGDEAGFDLFRDCVKLRAFLHGGKPAPHTEAFLGDGLWKIFNAVDDESWKRSLAARRIWEDVFGDSGQVLGNWVHILEYQHNLAKLWGPVGLEVCSSKPVTRSAWFELELQVPEYWREAVAKFVRDDPEPDSRWVAPEEEENEEPQANEDEEEEDWEVPSEPVRAPSSSKCRDGCVESCGSVALFGSVAFGTCVFFGLVLRSFGLWHEEVPPPPPVVAESLWTCAQELKSSKSLSMPSLEQSGRSQETCLRDAWFQTANPPTCSGGTGGLICRVMRNGPMRDVCYRFAGYEGRDVESLLKAFVGGPQSRSCRIYCDAPGATLERLGDHVARTLATNATLIPGWITTDGSAHNTPWTVVAPRPGRIITNPTAAAASAPHFVQLPRVQGCSGYCSNCTRNTFAELEKRECPCGFAYAVCQSKTADPKPGDPTTVSAAAGIQTTLKTVLHLLHELDHPKRHVDNCWYGCHDPYARYVTPSPKPEVFPSEHPVT